MTKFYVHAENYKDNTKKVFIFDNEFSTITDQQGASIDLSAFEEYKGNFYRRVKQWDKDHPIGKSSAPTRLKIQLGLKCNYTCEYCSQAAHVEGSIDFTPKHIDEFMIKLTHLDLTDVDQIEFWGGEPLVYWKTIRELTKRLHDAYPTVKFLLITNGSLFNQEINEFLEKYDFRVGISHDGPGQHLRGPDPFDDPDKMHWIQDLYKRLHPKHCISFNCILNAKNTSRLTIYNFFKDRFGEGVKMGEGYFLYVTHDGANDLSLYDYQDMIKYRRQSFSELDILERNNVYFKNKGISNFIHMIVNGRNYHTVNMRCGMDQETHLAVDMNGDVISCQNVGGNSNSFNGMSHRLGNVENMHDVKLNTGRHWSTRKECVQCPIVQMCAGMCFMLEDEYWYNTCSNQYNDIIPLFMYGFEILTGYIPYWIEPIDGTMEEWRKDLLGMQYPDLTRIRKKVIPIINIQ